MCFDFDCVSLLLNSVAQYYFWMLATRLLLNLTFIVFEISSFNKWKSNYILLLDIKLSHMSISVNSLFCCQCLSSKFSNHHVSIVAESICNFLWVIRFFWTEYAWFSSSAFEAVQEQAFSNDWDEKTSSQNLPEWCWYYIAIDSLRKQLRDLYTQYQHWCAAYNQAREDVNTQIRRIKSIDSALNMKRNAQVKKKTRYEADKQQMIIIAKFIDILHASQVLDENVRIWLKAEALKLNLLIAMKIVDASVTW